MSKHIIDATNQPMGRLASQIAVLLRGKHLPTFKPEKLPTEKVEVTNVAKMNITGAKLDNKVYYRYSGYPGGIYARTLRDRMVKDPAGVLRGAVMNMLPKNRSRSKIIKNLEIK